MTDPRFDISGVAPGARYRDDDAPPPAPSAPLPTAADAERARRTLSYGRADDFFAGPAPNCRSPADYEHYDYDACGTATVPNAALSLTQAGDVFSIDPSDVTQGGMGDCHVMATLIALARTRDGRTLIRNAIVENRNERGEVDSYTVTLHKRGWLGLGRLEPVQIKVDANFANGHAAPRCAVEPVPEADGGTRCEGEQEIWHLVLEKAYATLQGGYNAIGRGGVPEDAMEAFTGKDAERTSPSPSYPIEKLLAAGKMVVLETPPTLDKANAYHLVAAHAYAVLGVSADGNGRTFLHLANPWNRSQPEHVPCDELSKWFSRIDIGDVK